MNSVTKKQKCLISPLDLSFLFLYVYLEIGFEIFGDFRHISCEHSQVHSNFLQIFNFEFCVVLSLYHLNCEIV